MKKILSVLLALVMIVGMIPMSILTASAATIVTYEKVTSAPTDWSGTYLIVYEDGNGNAYIWTGVDAANTYASATYADGVIAGTTALEACEVTIAAMEGGYSVKAGTYGYMYGTSDKNKTNFNTTTEQLNTITMTADGDVEITSNTSVFRFNSNSGQCRFRYYKSASYASQQKVYLYKRVETEISCTHEGTTTTTNTVNATCTDAGSTTVVCECGVTISTTEIPALGHSWSDWTVGTEATETTAGVQSRACSACDATESAYIAATGTYKLTSSLEAGDIVLLVANTVPAELTSIDGIGNGTTYTDAPYGVMPLTVVDGASEGTYAFQNGTNYVSWSSGNTLATSETLDANASWTVTFDTDGNAKLVNNGTLDEDRYIAWNNGSPRFANYKATTLEGTYASSYAAVQLFEYYAEGEEIPVECTHEGTTTTIEGAKAATCTEAGYSGDTTCECGVVITYGEEIVATGHTGEWTETAATCETDGSKTRTCTTCGTVETEAISATGHTYVEGVCSVCGAEEPTEDVKIVFELGTNGDATHADGDSATEYTETVDGYTLTLADCTKMYTGAIDATGNGCIKLGTSKSAGGFSFTVPDDVTEVVISVAKYKANTTKVNINGTDYTLTNNSNDGAYDEITVDTSTSKTVVITTVSGGYRAMVNSITFICSETDHTCVWGEGVVTTAATCTTDGVMTYTCTVDGCTKTEPIDATGHTYVYGESAITCSACDYNTAYTLNTIAEAKAYSDASTVYYIKGIVTYVSGKNVYIEDATGAVCVYFNAAPSDIALGDEILVWDTMTAYKGLIETTNTTSQEYVKVSSGNTLPSQTVTIAALNADTTNEYLGERVVIENVTMGTINSSGNTPLTDADGNTINLYKVSGLNEAINVNDVVTVTVIVSTYNAYQLIVNPGTAADDVVEIEHHDEVVVETVEIATAKAGTAGEYYQVEGVVTFIDGRNVYIQDATGGIVVYLTATNSTAAIGDKIKAYGQLKLYNGLIELDGIDQTNTEQFEVLSNGNTVDAQAVTIADIAGDTTNEYLAEKITLNNVYVSYSYGYSSSYGNINYVLKDGDATVALYRVPVASETEAMAGGTIINVEAIVSSYNGYQLRVVGIESITVVGTCAHETTELVNVSAATCTEAGYTGDTMCTTCGYYTVEGEEIAATDHNYNAAGVCANNCGIVNVAAIGDTFYTTFADAYAAATDGQIIKLLADAGSADAAIELTKDLYVDLNGFFMTATAAEGTAYTVYGIDSCTDSYEAEEWGYLTVTNATVAPLYNSYLAVDEGDLGWSFHAYSVKLTYVTLKADADALGYKAEFKGDEVVQSYVTGFGFNLWVSETNVITKGYETAFTNGQIVTLRLQGIMAANGGEMAINAEAFVTFSNAGTVKSDAHSTTMKDTIETIETNLENGTATYTEAQIASIQGLIAKYESKMTGWNIDQIKAWTASTEA